MRVTRGTHRERWRPRRDGLDKVTGRQSYLTDLSFPGMLCGRILRSHQVHARIRRIDIRRALELPGVHAVLTHRDVPGLNRFGIEIQDQPVFCEERVRFVGDAVAAVAAETPEIAEAALGLITVEYDPLPVVDDPMAALLPSAPCLHGYESNVLHRAGYARGRVDEGFAQAAVIVEETYHTPRQMHAFMETEGGVGLYDPDGGVTIKAGSQHGHRDRVQLARILNLPLDKIRIVSSPSGGAFGGKDELTVQPYLALLALACRRPVKIRLSRAESVMAGVKRHPMQITMRTGADADGRIVAHDVRIVADTGAYATLGPAVLDFAVEHATGPYQIPHVRVEGVSVYTNNGVAGAFRGFGGNQVTFALEGQIERLAARLQLEPGAIRLKNLRSPRDPGTLGQQVAPVQDMRPIIQTMERSQVWARRRPGGQPSAVRWPWEPGGSRLVRGVGMAITIHGGGLGYGRPDPVGGSLRLREDGLIELAFGFEEFGQGVVSVIERLATEALGCGPEDLDIVIGDTARTPESGSTTASRATSVVFQVLGMIAGPWRDQMRKATGRARDIPVEALSLGPGGLYAATPAGPRMVLSYRELAECLAPGELPQAHAADQFPTTPDPKVGAHYVYSAAGVVAEVEIDVLTGRIRVAALEQAVAAGPVVDPMGYLGQVEGGAVMAIGYSLMEDAAMVGGRYVASNLDHYLIPGIADVPAELAVDALEELAPGDRLGPRGVGEIGTVAVAPAIAAAVYNAVGLWVDRLPVAPERVWAALGAGMSAADPDSEPSADREAIS